jgi:hypothetical protein
LLKFLESNLQALDSESKEKILSHSKNILDNDKQKQLGEDLNHLSNDESEHYGLCFKVIRELVISPIEKSYICKIEKELREDEGLERDIREIEEKLEEEKAKKLREYESMKSGCMTSSSKSFRTGFKEV